MTDRQMKDGQRPRSPEHAGDPPTYPTVTPGTNARAVTSSVTRHRPRGDRAAQASALWGVNFSVSSRAHGAHPAPRLAPPPVGSAPPQAGGARANPQLSSGGGLGSDTASQKRPLAVLEGARRRRGPLSRRSLGRASGFEASRPQPRELHLSQAHTFSGAGSVPSGVCQVSTLGTPHLPRSTLGARSEPRHDSATTEPESKLRGITKSRE